MLFTDQHMKQAQKALHKVTRFGSIGRGVTCSLHAESKPVDLMLKYNDYNWDTEYGRKLWSSGISASARAEVMWWDVTQELGGTWRRVPPAFQVGWVKLPAQKEFSGTAHYWAPTTRHGWELQNLSDRDDSIKMRVLDILLNNVDRNTTNSLVLDDELVWIDHGRSGYAETRWCSGKWIGEPQFINEFKPIEGQTPDTKGAVYHALADILLKWDAIRTIVELTNLPLADQMDEKLTALLYAVDKLSSYKEYKAVVRECSCKDCKSGKSASERS